MQPLPVGVRGGLWAALATGLLAGLVGFVLNFYQLGTAHLAQDEAQYALLTDDVRRGNWLRPSPYPPTVYNQKPPLYFWLSAVTYDFFGDPVRYRVWSAGAGVLSVVMTAYLGTRWLGAWTGLTGALLLAVHGRWLFIHGARDGTMDTLLTLLHLVMLWLAAGWVGQARQWPRLVISVGLIAVCASGASMLKPGFGAVLGSSVLVVGLFSSSAVVRKRMLVAAGVAVVCGLAVAVGWAVVGASGGAENVTRWVSDLGDDPAYYLRRLGASSPLHYLALPAMLVTLWFGRELREPRLLTMSIVPLVWLAVLSLAGGKNLHYLFAVLPLICLCLSWSLSEGVARMTGARWGRAVCRCGHITVAAYATIMAGYHLAVSVPLQNIPYAPVAFGAVEAGERVILLGMGTDQIYWRNELSLSATDCYYLVRLLERGAVARSELPTDGAAVVVAPLGTEVAKSLGTPVDGNKRVGVYRVMAPSR